METTMQRLQRKFRRYKNSKLEVDGILSETIDDKSSEKSVSLKPPVNIRLLLFQECRVTKEHQVLYDSTKINTFQSNSDEFSEIIFGSIGITQNSPSIMKIHHLKNKKQLMFSHIFCTCIQHTNSRSSCLDREIDNQSAQSNRKKACTMPNDSSPTDQTSFSSDSFLFLSSFLSRSFQGSTKGLRSTKSSSAPQLEEHKKKIIKMTNHRFAFGIIFEPEEADLSFFHEFFFKHFPLIEKHIKSMKQNIEKTIPKFLNRHFFTSMTQILDKFKIRFNNIYSSPRLSEMLWSKLTWTNLTTDHKLDTISKFVTDLSKMVLNFDSNSVNRQRFNFTSQLITAILTHHLGWVSSFHTISTDHTLTGQVDSNALWTQLKVLYGAVSNPMKTCKTVVTGSDHQTVSTVLTVLSYFIRSSRVEEQIKAPDLMTPEDFLSFREDLLEETLIEVDPASEYVLISHKNPTTRERHNSIETFELNGKRARSYAFISEDSAAVLKREPIFYGVFNQLNNEESSNHDPLTNSQSAISLNGSFCLNGDADNQSQTSSDEEANYMQMFTLNDLPSDVQSTVNCCFNDHMTDRDSVTSHSTSSFLSSYTKIQLDDVIAFESPTTDDADSVIAPGFASLMADYNPNFLNDFVLQGVAKTPDQIADDVIDDLKDTSLIETCQGVRVQEACCIVANTDNWSVKISSSKRMDSNRPSLPIISSKLVHNLLLQVANMYQMKFNPQFCMQHLENGLRVLVMKSETLVQYVKGNGRRITPNQLSAALSIESSDIPLLMAISSCQKKTHKNGWV